MVGLLCGVEFYVWCEEILLLLKDEYYFFEFVGCVCMDEVLGEIGMVIEVYEDGGGLFFEIECEIEDGM